jgi:2-isopropylmalate synthase
MTKCVYDILNRNLESPTMREKVAARVKVSLYDTTLRDGAQQAGLSFSVEDKLKIAKRLDELGVHYIEGGWPGANPKDAEFFARAQALNLAHAVLVVFGSTRRKDIEAADDPMLRDLLATGAGVFTLVGKSWGLQVTQVLNTTLEENLRMIADSIRYIKSGGNTVFFDAEHFFDGYKADAGYALRTVEAAAEAGADCVVLCDTNGGALPDEIASAVAAAKRWAFPSAFTRTMMASWAWPTLWQRCSQGSSRFRAQSTATASAAAMPISARSYLL